MFPSRIPPGQCKPSLSRRNCTNSPTQLTHGFPNDPNPLFQNIAFPIENRPGVESQSIEKAIDLLAPAVGKADVQDPSQRAQVERVLSDWHLLFFLTQCGMFDEVRSERLCVAIRANSHGDSQAQAELIARAAVAHESGDHAALEELMQTDSWKTLMTIMRDQANSKGAFARFCYRSGAEVSPRSASTGAKRRI